MGRLYLYGLAGLALVVAWHLFAPVQLTFAPRLGQLLGTIESEWAKYRTPEIAAQIEALAEAEARVERLSFVTQRAAEVEAGIANRQATSTANTHFLQVIGANVADGICGVAVLGSMQGNPDAAQYMEFCELGDDIRRGMAGDYAEAMDGGRTSVMEDMMEAFRVGQGD